MGQVRTGGTKGTQEAVVNLLPIRKDAGLSSSARVPAPPGKGKLRQEFALGPWRTPVSKLQSVGQGAPTWVSWHQEQMGKPWKGTWRGQRLTVEGTGAEQHEIEFRPKFCCSRSPGPFMTVGFSHSPTELA